MKTQKHKDIKKDFEYMSEWEFIEESMAACPDLKKKDQLAILRFAVEFLLTKVKNFYAKEAQLEKGSEDLHEESEEI